MPSTQRRRGCAESTPQPKRMILGKNALALESGGHRGAEPLCQDDQIGPCASRPEAQIKKWPAAGCEQASRTVEVFGTRKLRGRLLRACIQSSFLAKQVEFRGNLYDHRPGGRRACDAGGASDSGVELGSLFDRELSLCNRTRDRQLIDVVELKRLPGVTPNAAGQHQHGNAIQVSLGDTRERMGEASAGDHVNHRKFPGRAGDSVGHKRGTLLVGDEHGANLGGEGERVVQFDVVRTPGSATLAPGTCRLTRCGRISTRGSLTLTSGTRRNGAARCSGWRLTVKPNSSLPTTSGRGNGVNAQLAHYRFFLK